MTEEVFRQVTSQITPDLVYFLPEIALAVTACLVLLLDLVMAKRDSSQLAWVALVGTAVSAALLLSLDPFGASKSLFRAAEVVDGAATGQMTAHGMIWWDGFGNLFKLIFLAATAVTILLTFGHKPLGGMRHGEFYCPLLITTVGMCLMATASDMVMMIIGIEMVSIPSFVLVCFAKQTRHSTEAALKYVIYGSVASGMMIYGFSLLYGLTGTTQLAGMTQLAATGGDFALVFGVIAFLILAGFAYKMSMVPFHFWTPDIYQGAPTPVTAYLAVASKAAGFAVFIRFLSFFELLPQFGAAGSESFSWAIVVAVFSAVTMTVGNLGALMQSDVKRMLGYSSVAHAGYLLMGCVALFSSYADFPTGVQAIGFYLMVYFFMNFGAFAVLSAVESATERTDLRAFRGLGKRAPLAACAMGVFLFGLIGLPPTGGFIGKFGLFAVVLHKASTTYWLYWLALIAGVNTAISLFYYARLLREMFLIDPNKPPSDSADLADREKTPDTPLTLAPLASAVAFVCMLGTIYLGVFFGGALDQTRVMTMGQLPSAEVAR